MKLRTLLLGAAALTLTGCGTDYNFFPDKKANEHYESLSVEDRSISLTQRSSDLTITSVEESIGPWTAPRMTFEIKNTTEDKIMTIKASDIRAGFSGFWFDVVDYTVIQKDRPEELSFNNTENFKYEHEVLPQETITLDVIFETPKSEEYYSKKNVLIEVYTNLDIFYATYKIKKTRK